MPLALSVPVHTMVCPVQPDDICELVPLVESAVWIHWRLLGSSHICPVPSPPDTVRFSILVPSADMVETVVTCGFEPSTALTEQVHVPNKKRMLDMLCAALGAVSAAARLAPSAEASSSAAAGSPYIFIFIATTPWR